MARKAMRKTRQSPDVQIENHGSIMLFRYHTTEAQTWINDHVSDEAQFFGNALVVEPRYAENLAFGMIEAGLVVA